MRECATDSAASNARFSASSEPMSGLAAPLRTAMPTPEEPSGRRVPGITLPVPTSWSMPSAVRMTTSALVPSAIDFSSAWVAWNSACRPGAAALSTPFMASVLRTARSSKRGFEREVDVIGASVHIAEELRLAEGARAVRHADADVSIARHAHVEARVEVVEQFPVAAAAPALVTQLHLRDLLGVGKPASHAEARVQAPALPAEAVPVDLEERHHRPEVILVALLEVALDADKAREIDRPAARVLDELAADVQRGDVRIVDRVPRRTAEPHDLQHVAVAGIAVQHLGDERPRLRRPASPFGREVIHEADEGLRIKPALGERARRDFARAASRPDAAEDMPALGKRIVSVERCREIESSGAGGAPVVREALESVGDERIEPPIALPELQPGARAVQVSAPAFVEVEWQVVRAALRAAVSRTLKAQQVPDRRAGD